MGESDYNIGLGIEDKFSSALKSMQYQMALVQNATSASAKELTALEQSAAKLSGVNSQFQALSQSVKEFSDFTKGTGYAPKIMFEEMAAGLDKARASITSTVPAAQAATQAHEELGASAQKTGLNFGQMVIAMGAGSMIGNVLTGVLRQVSSTLMSIPQMAIAVNASFEQTRVAFKTLLESGEKADVFLKQLWDFAATTPFEFPELTQAAQRMKAFGFATEEILPLMEAVGNISSALGGGSEIVGRMTYNLGQMKAMGKVTGRELRDLAMAGVNLGDVYDIIAKKMGKTTAEIKGILNSARGASGIDIDIFLEAFKEVGTSGKFLGAMAEQAKTFTGAMSTIRDNAQGLVRDGFKPMFEWVSKLTYQFSLFMQGKDFARITTALSGAMQQITGGLPSISGDTFAPLVDGAIKAIEFCTKLALVIKDNLTPIMVGLGTAATLTLAAITVALAGATGGLSLIIPTIAVGIALLTKAILDTKKAETEHQAEISKTADALGEQGERYKWLAAQIAELEKKTAGRGKEGLVNQKDLELLDKYRGEYGKLEDSLRHAQAEWYQSYQEGMATAQKGYVYEEPVLPQNATFDIFAGVDFKKVQDAADKVAEAWGNTMDSLDKSVGDTFSKMGEAAVLAGEKSISWLNGLAEAAGFTRTPLENVQFLMQSIGQKVSVLGADMQQVVAEKIGSIKKALDDSKGSADGYGTALSNLEGLLDAVTAATRKAADAQKWKDLFNEIGKGVAGPMEAYYKALANPPKTPYDDKAFADKQYSIAQQQRKLLEMEETYRRQTGTSVSPELNWKTAPAAGELAMFKLEIEKLRRDIQGAEGDLGKMSAANAEVGNSGVKAFQDMMQAQGQQLLAWIRGEETKKNLSKSETDMLIAQTEKSYGVQMSVTDKYMRAQEEQKARLGEMGAETLRWWIEANAAAQAAKDPVAEIVRLTDLKVKKDQEVTDKANEALGVFELIAEAQAGNTEATAGQKTKQDELKTSLDSTKKSYDDIAKVSSEIYSDLKNMTSKSWLIKLVASVTGGGNGGRPKPPKPPDEEGWIWNWDEASWSWVKAPAPNGNPALGPDLGPQNLTPRNTPPAPNPTQAAQQIVNEIQIMLGLFAGLSIDPRVKDMADTASTVVNAFKSGMDALSGLKDFVAPARSAVDAAFAEVTYIHGRMQAYIAAFVGAFNSDDMSNVASAAGTMLNAFASGIQTLIMLKDYTAPARSAIDSALADMMYIAQQFVAQAPTFSQEVLVTVTKLAEAIGAIGSALSNAVQGMSAAANFPELKTETPFANISDAIQRWVKGFVWLSGIYNDPEVIKSINALATTVGLIGEALNKITEPMRKAAAFPALVGEHPFANIGDAIKRWVTGLAWMNDPAVIGYDPERAAELAVIIQTIGNGLGAVIQSLKDALTFPTIPAVAPFNNLGVALREIVTKMAEWKADFGDAANNVKDFAVTLGQVLDPMQTVLSVVNGMIDLAEKVSNGMTDFAQAGTILTDVTRSVVAILRDWANPDNINFISIPAGLEDFAAMLGNILAPMQTILSLSANMLDLGKQIAEDAIAPGDTATFTYINTTTRLLVDLLKAWAATNNRDFISIPDDLGKFSERLEKVLAPMQTILGVINGIRDLGKSIADEAVNTDTVWEVVNSVVTGMIDQMTKWTYGASAGGGREIGGALFIDDTMIALAEKLEKVLAPMQTAISVISGLLNYAQEARRNTAQISTVLPQFFIDMKDIIQQFVDTQWPNVDNIKDEMLAKISGIVSVMSNTVGLLSSLREYITNAHGETVDMTTAITAMVDSLQLAVTEYIWQIASITGIDDIESETAATVGNIVLAMSGALSLFEGLQKYKQVPKANLDLFIAALRYAIEHYLIAMGGIDALGDDATSKAAGTVSAIVSALGAAVELFAGLRGYADVPQTQIRLFILDLAYAVGQFIEEVLPPVEAIGAEKAEKVAKAVEAIVNALGASVVFFNALNADGGFADVAVTEMTNLKVAIVGTDGKGGIVKIFGEIMAAIDTMLTGDVPAMAGIIETLVNALSTAVAFFRDIDNFADVPDTAFTNISAGFLGDALDGNGGAIGAIKRIAMALTDAVQGQVSTFAGNMSAIHDAFLAATNTLTMIATYSIPLPAKFQQFVNDLIGGGTGAAATMGVLGILRQVATAWNETATGYAATFKTAVESIKQPFEDAFAIFATLRTDSITPIASMNAFIADTNALLVLLQNLGTAAGAVDLTDVSTLLQGFAARAFAMDSAWFSAGWSWIDRLVFGMTSNEGALTRYLQHIRDLLPSSPAKTGPLSKPVNWDSYLATGLDDASLTLSNALGGISLGGSIPMAAQTSSGQVINITVSGNTFTGEADEDRMIRKLTDALRRQGVAL